MKVNYDRLLTNDKHNKGNVSMENKPFDISQTTKNGTMHSNTVILSASVRLDYPYKDRAYYQQS